MLSFGPLVTTSWLAETADEPTVKIIDGSWRMPGGAPARTDYENRHIVGAVFFDIDAVADQQSSLPHMLPTPAEFAEHAGALGLSPKDKIVVYDDQGIFSAARVWWAFRAMGHKDVAVLDGGLPKWLRENRAVTNTKTVIQPTHYKTQPKASLVSNADEVRAALSDTNQEIVDARPSARFLGTAPEPRDGLHTGHMPGAKTIPFGNLINADGAMRPADEIKTIFAEANVDLSLNIITSCGSGVTAAVLSLALEIIGHDRHSLYDGSWAEWGNKDNDKREFPVTTG